MTTPTNPGAPRMEPLAFERLRTLIADELGEKPYASDLALRLATQLFSYMRFDYDINSHGVPVRRVLAYGQWEVDPNGLREALANPPLPKERDVVRFSVGADRETEWDVIQVRRTRLGSAVVLMADAAGRQVDGVKAEHVEILRPGSVGPAHGGPRRGDAVAVWLKSKRDEFEPGDPGYFTLDRILDDYRLHADTGDPLSTPANDLGPHAPGEV